MATRSDLHCLLDASSELPSEYTRHFANYLQKHHQAEIEGILMELDAASSAHYSVSVNVLDLLQENLALGTLLLHHPQDLLERFDAALVVAQEQVMSNHDDVHFMAVKESAHARPHHLPRCRELWKETVSSIRMPPGSNPRLALDRSPHAPGRSVTDTLSLALDRRGEHQHAALGVGHGDP